MLFPATTKLVAGSTDAEVNARIRQETLRNVASYQYASEQEISVRIQALQKEWDTERLLEVSSASLTAIFTYLGFRRGKYWFLLPGIVSGFLLQHALWGWCPPLPIIRRLGVRTAAEIHHEISALKVLRGDFTITREPAEALMESTT